MRDIQATTLFFVSLAFSVISVFSPLSAIPASLFLIAAVVIFLVNSKEDKKNVALEARVDRLEKQIALQFGVKR